MVSYVARLNKTCNFLVSVDVQEGITTAVYNRWKLKRTQKEASKEKNVAMQHKYVINYNLDWKEWTGSMFS